MKSKNLLWTLLIFIIGFASCAVVTQFNFLMTGTVKSQGPEDPLEAWSEAEYIIWAYNSTYYASRNMSVNMVETLCDNLTYACVMTDGNLSNGGLIWLKQVQKPAAYTPSANVTVWESYLDQVKIYTATYSGKVGDCPQQVSGSYSHPSGTAEQTLLEITPSVITDLKTLYLYTVNLTQACTIKVYFKDAGGTYREASSMRLTGVPAATPCIPMQPITITATTDFKITITSTVAEGTTRVISYIYIKEEF